MASPFGVMNADFAREVFGDSADRLIEAGFDIGALRPYRGKDGRSYVTRTIDGKPKVMVTNAPSVLTYDAYKLFDDTIVTTLQENLKLLADVRSRPGMTYNIPNGMAHTMLQYQTQGDITPATISMDPVRRSEGDRAETNIITFPLPIIHKDFDFSAREIATSRLGQLPLDTSTAALAATKVAQAIEQLATGVISFTYGGSTIYGLINFPYRATKTDLTAPTGSNGTTVINELLAVRQMLIDDKHFGPYRLYVNSQWAQVLDNDFSTAKGDNTLRQRILAIKDIEDIVTLDFLPTTQWHYALVEMKSSTVRSVVGFEAQTIQWESLGGMRKHFKVMAMVLLQLRADTDGNSGVAHARTA